MASQRVRNQHFIIKKSHGHTNSLILCTLKFGEEVQPPTGRDKDRCHERIHGDANNSDFDREHFFCLIKTIIIKRCFTRDSFFSSLINHHSPRRKSKFVGSISNSTFLFQ